MIFFALKKYLVLSVSWIKILFMFRYCFLFSHVGVKFIENFKVSLPMIIGISKTELKM